jgi:hypothetical protein
MAALYSGNLLVKVRQRPFAGLLAGPQLLAIPGYRLEPLFKARHANPMFSALQPGRSLSNHHGERRERCPSLG